MLTRGGQLAAMQHMYYYFQTQSNKEVIAIAHHVT